MIEKVNYISVLDKLQLPKDQYLISGGAWLSLLGIRENDDIDMIISDDLRSKLDGYLSKLSPQDQEEVRKFIDFSPKHGRKQAAIAGESMNGLVKKHYVDVDGYRFVKFGIYQDYKAPRKRPKDKEDRNGIKKFFKANKHLLPEYRDLLR